MKRVEQEAHGTALEALEERYGLEYAEAWRLIRALPYSQIPDGWDLLNFIEELEKIGMVAST